jgi:hypothetical protein
MGEGRIGNWNELSGLVRNLELLGVSVVLLVPFLATPRDFFAQRAYH